VAPAISSSSSYTIAGRVSRRVFLTARRLPAKFGSVAAEPQMIKGRTWWWKWLFWLFVVGVVIVLFEKV